MKKKCHFFNIITIALLLIAAISYFIPNGFAKWQYVGATSNTNGISTQINEWTFITFNYDENGNIIGSDGEKEIIIIPTTDENGQTITHIVNLGVTDETTEITIPNTVSQIDQNAFGNLNPNATVNFEGTPEQFNQAGGYLALQQTAFNNAINNNDYLSAVYLYFGYSVSQYTPKVNFIN